MQYLVTEELIDPGPLLPSDQLGNYLLDAACVPASVIFLS
jgi:hypothetical protein